MEELWLVPCGYQRIANLRLIGKVITITIGSYDREANGRRRKLADVVFNRFSFEV
jgi:hypothetical protein